MVRGFTINYGGNKTLTNQTRFDPRQLQGPGARCSSGNLSACQRDAVVVASAGIQPAPVPVPTTIRRRAIRRVYSKAERRERFLERRSDRLTNPFRTFAVDPFRAQYERREANLRAQAYDRAQVRRRLNQQRQLRRQWWR